MCEAVDILTIGTEGGIMTICGSSGQCKAYNQSKVNWNGLGHHSID